MEDVRNAQEVQTNAADSSIVDSIESKIFNIRGRQVMLDRDLSVLYGVETKVLNQAVKRNIERFLEDFMFKLTNEECLRSQIDLNPKIQTHYERIKTQR